MPTRMNLQIKRPIVTFDIEATGLNVAQDRLIEIAILKVFPDGKEETFETLVNPDVEVSREIEELTGITNEKLKGQPNFKAVADQILAFIDGCDLVGYNFHKLDIPLLAEEFLRVGIDFDIENRRLIDVQNIFHKMEQRTLIAAYKFYCEKDLTDAHSAMADTKATWEVLNAQLQRYSNLKNDVEFLAEFSQNSKNGFADFAGRLIHNEKGEVCYNFGKHKGLSVAAVNEIEPGYYGWFIGERTDFPQYTKNVLRKEMERLKAAGIIAQTVTKPTTEKKNFTKKQPKASLEDKLDALKNKFNKNL